LFQKYSVAMGRCAGGRGSHSFASDGGGLITVQSAKLIVRPYRNTPFDVVMLNEPCWA
jgi:hypothetical protein